MPKSQKGDIGLPRGCQMSTSTTFWPGLEEWRKMLICWTGVHPWGGPVLEELPGFCPGILGARNIYWYTSVDLSIKLTDWMWNRSLCGQDRLSWLVCGIDRYVGMVVYPDWFVESIDMRIPHLQYAWPSRGRTYITPDRYVVSPAVFLGAAWSHL